MPTGYCTLDDVRRALRKAGLPGDADQDKDIAVDAIAGQTQWVEKNTHRHWYVSNGIGEDTEGLFPTTALSRDDEHDISRHGGMVHGDSEIDRYQYSRNSDSLLESGPRYERRRRDFRDPKQEIRIAIGGATALEPPIDDTTPAYTRIRLARKNVQAINTLNVINADGGYDDWVASTDYAGGVGNPSRGDDYWARVNSGGVSELYLDVHAMDDEIASLSNAVYIDFDHGYEGSDEDDSKIRGVRRAVAFRAGADLVEEAVIEIPSNVTLYNIETKAEEMRSRAAEILEPYMVGSDDGDD